LFLAVFCADALHLEQAGVRLRLNGVKIEKDSTLAVRQTVQALAPLTTGAFEVGIELMEMVDFGISESNISKVGHFQSI